MKKSLFTFLFLFFITGSYAQWTEYNMTYKNHQRQYEVYLPVPLQKDAKLVILLHGLGGSMHDFENTNWPNISDTANLILVAPQGLPFDSPLGSIPGCFNAGMVLNLPVFGQIAVNGDIDDIGFINTVMDKVIARRSVNLNRVYVTGFSNGGFMTQYLSTQSTHRFSAAASVSGLRANSLPPIPKNTYLPIAHFHGTNDPVVSWDGYVSLGPVSDTMGISVDKLINEWRTTDAAFGVSDTLLIGDTTDALYITHYTFRNKAGKSLVELFKIHNGVHVYYGYGQTNGVFDIPILTWQFFNKHTQRGVLNINQTSPFKSRFSLFPNPAHYKIHIKGDLSKIRKVSIVNIIGQTVYTTEKPSSSLNISTLPSGSYFVLLKSKDGEIAVLKFIK